MPFECRCRNAFLAAALAAALAVAAAIDPEAFLPNQPDAVPSFLIIGTAKGGTTDMYQQLTEEAVNRAPGRPDPPLPSGAPKEAGLLSRGGIDAGKLLPQRGQYIEYLRLLHHPCGNATEGTFQECIDVSGPKQLTLDATPTYSFSAVAPLLLRELSPLSKVVMMIREPVERAEVLFRHNVLAQGHWTNTSIDALAADFFISLRSVRGVAPALRRAAACPPSDVLCAANAWRDLSGLTLMDSVEHKLFIGGMYRYALAVWRYHYFQPGRVMVVDSHVYFERREEVMAEVIRFLYGRPMLPEERALATFGTVWRKAHVAPSPRHTLSPALRRQLTEFYDVHVMQGMFQMLSDMRDEGAKVVGFDGEPWRGCPGFDEFNRDRPNRVAGSEAEAGGDGAGGETGEVGEREGVKVAAGREKIGKERERRHKRAAYDSRKQVVVR